VSWVRSPRTATSSRWRWRITASAGRTVWWAWPWFSCATSPTARAACAGVRSGRASTPTRRASRWCASCPSGPPTRWPRRLSSWSLRRAPWRRDDKPRGGGDAETPRSEIFNADSALQNRSSSVSDGLRRGGAFGRRSDQYLNFQATKKSSKLMNSFSSRALLQLLMVMKNYFRVVRSELNLPSVGRSEQLFTKPTFHWSGNRINPVHPVYHK